MAVPRDMLDYFRSIVEGREPLSGYVNWYHQNRAHVLALDPVLRMILRHEPLKAMRLMLDQAGIAYAAAPPPPTSEPIDDDEYAVISAYLEHHAQQQRGAGPIVVSAQTDPAALCGPEQLWQFAEAGLAACVDDLAGKATAEQRFDPRFAGAPVVLLEPENQRVLFGQSVRARRGGWEMFRRTYRGAQGICTFSRVGFNVLRDRAIVYCGHHLGPDTGNGLYAVAQKADASWRLQWGKVVWTAQLPPGAIPPGANPPGAPAPPAPPPA